MPALPFLIQGHSLSWSCATLKCPGACLSLAETTWWNHCNIPPGTPLPGTGTSEFHPGQLITPFRSKAVAIYKANVFVKGLSNYFSPDPALTIAGLRSCLCLDIRERAVVMEALNFSVVLRVSFMFWNSRYAPFGWPCFCSVLITQQDSPCITGS